MAEILVLVDHVDGTVRKPTLELLTLARRLGEPSAVFLGPGADAATDVLGTYGAQKVYVVDAPEVAEHWSLRPSTPSRRSPRAADRVPCCCRRASTARRPPLGSPSAWSQG